MYIYLSQVSRTKQTFVYGWLYTVFVVFMLSPIPVTCRVHGIVLDFSCLIMFGEPHILRNSALRKMLSSLLLILRRLQKNCIATINFVMSVRSSACLSFHMEQLGTHWTDFHEIWYLSIFWKLVWQFQVWLKPGKNKGYFTWRPVYIYGNISPNSS